jgi:ribosomal protein L29
MATLKIKEIRKMNAEERTKKLKEMKMEMIKSKAGASKTGKTQAKQIRKVIARILTLNKLEEVQNKA